MADLNDKGWVDNVRVLDGADVPPREARGALARQEAAAVSVDAARVASETQAMILMAHQNPRNHKDVLRAMQEACGRLRLAEQATYRFPRGKQSVTGPTIRLVEALAAAYGNIDAGWRVLEQDGQDARVEAYAWDMERNLRKRLEWWMRVARDVGERVVDVHGERDRYEVIASQAQRRVRACLLNILPFDLVDEAVERCADTVKKGDGTMPLRERIERMMLSFEEVGVNEAMIAANLGHPTQAIIASELPRLREIYNALRDHMARPEDFFDLGLAGQAPAPRVAPPAQPTAQATEQRPEARKAENSRPAGPPAQPAAPAVADPRAPLELDAAAEASQAALVLKRLRAYKLSDDEIARRLGGSINGAPLNELERVYREEEGRRLAKRRGKAAPDPETGEIPAFALESPPSDAAGPQGGYDDGQF